MADSDKDPTEPEPPQEGSGPAARSEQPDAASKPPTRPDGAPAAVPERASPKPRKTGRALATLSLLLSLAAIGGSGYLLYSAWLDQPEARLEAAIGTYQGELADFHRATTEEVGALRKELAQLADELLAQRQALTEARTAMTDSVADHAASAPPTPREWKLAEVEYLLTVANHRLVMQDDAEGAERLLALADRVLIDLDEFRFHEVRALLAEERLALKTFEYADTKGIFLRLEAVKKSLRRLPLRLPEYASENAARPEADADASMLDALLGRLGALVRFRRHDGGAIRPLLAPSEAEYLEQHLRLALERAQLAVLRRDQEILEISLGAARDWLHRFLDPGRTVVAEVLRELDALRDADLEVPLPDISRSLERLRELRRTDTDPAAPT